MTRAVREREAVPAVTAVVRGTPVVGLRDDELERFLRCEGISKVSARDLAVAMARGEDGATTVAATLVLAEAAGIAVFATGGIGGVHREPAFDESADLAELARTPMVVVCAGAKAILDLRATLERLESLGVTVVGYGTSELPAFYSVESGIALPARLDSAAEIASAWQSQRALGRRQALVVMQPPPASDAVPAAEIERATERALERARRDGIRGGAVTPYLLREVDDETRGRARGANLALLEHNAALAAEIAVAIAANGDPTRRSD
jgi:pseudouridine-5'-phosphate glycosidase